MTCRASQGDGMFCAPRFDYTEKRAEPWWRRGPRLGVFTDVTSNGFVKTIHLRGTFGMFGSLALSIAHLSLCSGVAEATSSPLAST
jgi:hypothetical protein